MPPKKKRNPELSAKLNARITAKRIGRLTYDAQEEKIHELKSQAKGKSAAAHKAGTLLELVENEIEEKEERDNRLFEPTSCD